jgi:hypothetical protein
MKMERRKSPRQRSFLHGFVRLGDQNYSLDCVVRDVSETGAKLRLKFPISLAALARMERGHVELHIPEKQKTVQASVVWVDNCEMGISFRVPVTIADPAPTTADAADAELLDRVARLEAEITRLKQLLKHREEHRDSKTKVA